MAEIEEESAKVVSDSYRDSCKLFFDFYKHVTTISVGSIVLLVSLFTKLEGQVQEQEYLLLALKMFIASIVGSAIAMFVYAGHIQGRKEIQKFCLTVIVVATVLVAAGLIGGLTALYFFAEKNI